SPPPPTAPRRPSPSKPSNMRAPTPTARRSASASRWSSSRTAPDSSSPSRLVLLLVVAECLFQPSQHFGGGFEHSPQLGFIHLGDILAQVVHRLLQPDLHVARMVTRVFVAFTCHKVSPSVADPTTVGSAVANPTRKNI